jgi:hypothetical protein
MTSEFPVILSFDVGVIHLSYCLLTKKEFSKSDGTKYIDWCIIDWNNIDLTKRDDEKCECGSKASLIQVVNNKPQYYCKVHARKINTETQPFETVFCECEKKNDNKCCYTINTKSESKLCSKKACYSKSNNYYCGTHAKQIFKTENKLQQIKSFKTKSSRTLNFDDVKYDLIMELENRVNLLSANYVVIENQPSFKNPRMKSIATTIYDYYLIRGIIDKEKTKSSINQVKFMSPSNKLKIVSDGDNKQLVKAKSTTDTAAYKLTKSLGIKYCLELINHLPESIAHFKSHKKKDDLADSFLQGAYFYTHSIKV